VKHLTVIAALLSAACTTVPPTNVHQPMSARPMPRYEAAANNGSIYQVASARPLFEDRRARFVGDTLTIRITENTSASKKGNNQINRTGSNTASVTGLSGLPGKGLLGLDLGASNTSTFNGKGEAANSAVFSGSMTVTVIDVMPNGNLLVSGEKQISVGNEQEFVRVSGVVNPAFVDFSNSIDSSKVADARIEYKSSGQIADGQSMGWLARFFLNVMPF